MKDWPRAMAIGSLVLGLLSLATGLCCGLCGSPVPIAGLILGIVAVSQTHDRGLAIAGIVVNVIGFVVIATMIALNSYVLFGGGQTGLGGVQPFQDLLPEPLDATDPPTHDPTTAPATPPEEPSPSPSPPGSADEHLPGPPAPPPNP